MRSRNTALPKSYSWLPGVKMSGRTMLVRFTMLAPWSRLDISEGERVSPAWAKITLPPERSSPRALGLHHGGEPGEAAAALAVRHLHVAHQIDVVDQDEGHLRGGRRRRRGKAHARSSERAAGRWRRGG